MLGSLARWLRVLGFDVLYARDLDDAAIVRCAVAEKRTILTRDTHLVRRRDAGDHILIRSDSLAAQIEQVCRERGMRPQAKAMLQRCLRCNRPLEAVAAPAVTGQVPAYVARTQRRFQRCPACRRLYWRATHVTRMLERLRELGVAVHDGPDGDSGACP